jgi:2-keto-4-pentenoate hydratase
MKRFGVEEPMYGPIFAPDVYQSPAQPEARRFQHFCLETEFAYRLGRALPARSTAYKREEVLDAVDAVVPAFELINPRYESIPFERVALAIADCGLNGGLVLGTPITEWRRLDLPRRPVRLLVEGVLKGEGSGADALGDPANVLEWVVNKLSAAGIGASEGQVISTGTCTGVVFIEKGQTAVGDFGELGRVELRFV